jgi:membrane-associated protein
MEIINFFIEFILHLDQYLNEIIQAYGTWTYAILFLIVFIETGLVIMPFLPGDSLLFAAGTFAALGKIGPRAFDQDLPFLKRDYLEKTQAFYEKHGGKTIILARFVPIVRTFAPFVAGVGTMNYRRFFTFNVFGAFLWATIFVFLGYFFGNIPFVKQNFELAILAIVLISGVPMVIEYVRGRARTSPHTAETLESQAIKAD